MAPSPTEAGQGAGPDPGEMGHLGQPELHTLGQVGSCVWYPLCFPFLPPPRSWGWQARTFGGTDPHSRLRVPPPSRFCAGPAASVCG